MAPAYEDCVDAVDRQGLEQWTGDVIYLDRDRARREYDQAQQDAAWLDKSIAAVVSPIPLARDKAVEQVARRSEAARARRSLHARAGPGARGSRAAGAHAVRRAADRAQPLHARHVRPAVARGAGHLGAQARHLRLGLPGRRDAGDAAAAAAAAGAGGVQALPRRARRGRGGHRRGRLDQHAPAQEPAHLARCRRRRASGARSDRRSRERAARRDRRRDARGHDRLPARAQAGHARAARRVQGAAAAGVLRARRRQDADGPGRADRSRRHLVRRPVRRARQADRAAPRSLPAPDAVRELARPEDPAREMADDDRVVAQRDARRRPRLHEVQELRHRAARVAADRRDAGLDSARRDAGEGSPEDARCWIARSGRSPSSTRT